jgi:ribosomal protein S18 acetylase RimI-like enzyme
VITYKNNIENVKPGDISGFFEGWKYPVSPERHLEILSNSSHVVLAMDGNKVAGFINAVSDKTLSAYIPMLEVLPGYRGAGIGRELVKKMLAVLKDFYMVDLCCDDDLAGFYRKFGMSKCTGMIRRNYETLKKESGS